jgi:hypothetical protein
MAILLRVGVLLAGIAILAATWRSVITTLIIPRATRGLFSRWLWDVTYWSICWIAGWFSGRQRRDSVMSFLAPINLILLLHGWIFCFVLGYGLIFYGALASGFPAALELAGSSVFTLGIAAGPAGMGRFIEFAAAASGMIVIGLQVGYLPAIYGAYSARENLVTQLRFRCGFNSQVDAASLLANVAEGRAWDRLGDLFMSWESCAAAITESHVSYPWLMVFRSPVSNDSWITSVLAVLDAATLLHVIAGLEAPVESTSCARACEASLERLASIVTPYPRPAHFPEGALLTRAEFALAYERVVARFASPVSPEAAFSCFCAERKRYEGYALALARFVRLPLDGWLRPCDGQSLRATQPPRVV